MFTLKNSIKNIYRYKNKYIMFGTLYLILILAVSVCVNIFVYTNEITDNILIEYAGVSRLNKSSTSIFEFIDSPAKNEYLKLKEMEGICDIRFLKYNFATDFLKENVLDLEVTVNIGGNVTLINTASHAPVFVLGYNMSLLHLAVDEFNLEKGRMFENDGEAVITKNSKFVPIKPRIWNEASASWNELELKNEHEQWNDLDLGDKIIIKNDDGFYKEFTVVGIQEENPDNDIDTNRRMIYTTLEAAEYFDVIALIEGAGLHGYDVAPNQDFEYSNLIKMGYDVLVYLDSPENFLTLNNYLINNDINISGLSVSITPLFFDFWTIIRVTKNTQSLSELFIILITIIIICMTIIATIILLNNRKYEIAVLRSAGMKKIRIIVNYLIENLAFIWGITLIAFIAAQFIAPLFTNRMFENLRELVAPEMFRYLTNVGDVELILQSAGFVFGGTTIIVMLSLILACVNIVRFEPLKIFNKNY